MPETGTVHKTLIKGYSFEWKINNLFSALDKDGDCYYSPSFSYDNESWFLGIEPIGDSNNDSFEYINLYLYRKSSGPTIRQKFSLALKTASGSKDYERLCTSVFEQWKPFQFLRFLPRSEVLKRKSELVPSGVITVVCTLQTSKSPESASDTSTAECSYCKESFSSDFILSHTKKCLDRPIKCPDCSSVILLQDWYEHGCQASRVQGVNVIMSPASPQKKKILQDLKELFCKQEDCDVVIKIQDKEFHAHRAILSARSPVLASAFRSDMREKATGVMDIKDCDPSTFSDFLCFLYCEEIENLSTENMFGLFSTADKYDVPDLREKCMDFIKANLSVDTFCSTLTLALQHSETELLKLASDFFIRNAPTIIVSSKWQTFLMENPIQGNELFIKYSTSVRC